MSRITRPGVALVDVEKVLLSIAPKDEDGRAVPVDGITWEVQDNAVANPADDGAAVVTLEPAQDENGNDLPGARWAVSGVPGSATVVVKAGELEEAVPLTVSVGAPNELNLSAGTPVHE